MASPPAQAKRVVSYPTAPTTSAVPSLMAESQLQCCHLATMTIDHRQETAAPPPPCLSLGGAWRCYPHLYVAFDEGVPAMPPSRSHVAFDEGEPAAPPLVRVSRSMRVSQLHPPLVHMSRLMRVSQPRLPLGCVLCSMRVC